jgi:hypothetical protein
LKTIKLIQMKRILSTTAVVLSVMLLASFSNTISAQPRTDIGISYQTFYDELDPYGRWVDYPDHGYVWIPDAGSDFRPYSTNGHWVWSDDYEWMWVSDYDWGWAPFHYGRWLQDPYYGWIWVPGYEWSPAWVAWRDGGDYYGWAPLRPGINISLNFSLGGYNPPIDYWCFAPRRYITSHRIYDYYVPRRNNITIINQTTIINNYRYNQNVYRTGPGRRDAERYAGRINPVRFRESNSPGRTRFRNNELSVYRPQVRRDEGRNFTPRRVETYNREGRNSGNITRRNGNNLPERRFGNNNNNNRFERQDADRRQGNNDRVRQQPKNFERSERMANPRRNNDNQNQEGNIRKRNQRIERPDNDNGRQAAPPENRNFERRSNPNFERRSNPNIERRPERNNPSVERNSEMRERRSPERRNVEQPRQQQNRNFGNERRMEQRQEAPRREMKTERSQQSPRGKKDR